MTKNGIIKCLFLLQGAYPTTYKNYTKEDWELATELWNIQFNGCEDLLVWKALNETISESEFPPTIAGIKKHLVKEESYNEEEDWRLLLKAGRNDIEYAREEWDKLPELFKKVTTPQTLVDIGRASDEAVKFIKRDIMAAYREQRTKAQSELLISFNKVPQLEAK